MSFLLEAPPSPAQDTSPTSSALDGFDQVAEPAGRHLTSPPPRSEAPLLRRVLQDRTALLQEIVAGARPALGGVAALSFLLAALAGLALGTPNGLAQALSAAFKAPLIGLGTLGVCFPAFYVFALLQGSRLSLGQALRILAVGLGLRGAILAGLTPLLLFFSSVGSPYAFLLLLAIAIFGAGEFALLRTLHQGAQLLRASGDRLSQSLVSGWSLLYLLVIAQMTWTLRPLIGHPETFADQGWHFLGGPGGNMFTYVATEVARAFGG